MTQEELDLQQGLVVDLDGYSGPLHLLLEMARKQKIDLLEISILDLVEQYLSYIRDQEDLRIDTAADYLVMAAWLTFLKSRLLLPEKDILEDELDGEEMAAQLKARLIRLEAMRKSADELMDQKRLGIHVFRRGMPEKIRCIQSSLWQADLMDLLKAYALQKEKSEVKILTVHERPVWSLKQARERLMEMLGSLGHMSTGEWQRLDSHLLEFLSSPTEYRSAMASSFGASLELARDAEIELQQEEAFGPLYLRNKMSKSNK